MAFHALGPWQTGPPRARKVASLVLEKLMLLGAKLQQAIAPKLPEWIKRPSGVTPILQKLKQVRRTDLVLALLEELGADYRMKLGPTHYSIGMSACNAAKQWSLSLHLFNSMSQTMLSPDVFSFSTAISSCEKGGQWQLALQLFSDMPASELNPDVFTYNATLSCCAKAGQWQLAWQLFERMPQTGLKPDVVSYNSSISACERGGQWQLALFLFSSIRSCEFSADIHTFRAAISSLEKGAQWQRALEVFESIPRAGLTANIYTYNATVSACEKASNWQGSLHFFEAMLASKVIPNIITHNALISSCGKGGQWQLAAFLFSNIPNAQLSPNTISYNSAMSSCEKGSHWEYSLHLFTGMPGSLLSPDVISYSAAISSFEKGAQWQLAVALFHAMPAAHIVPDRVSYNTTISSLEKSGEWQLALQLFQSMPLVKLAPDVVSCNATISSCEKGGQWELALNLFNAIPDLQLKPDVISFGATLVSLDKGEQWQLALQLFGSMPAWTVTPNILSFGTAISTCARGEHWPMALHLLDVMPASDLTPSVISYNAIISSCSRGQNWQLAMNVFDAILRARVSPKVSQGLFLGWKVFLLVLFLPADTELMQVNVTDSMRESGDSVCQGAGSLNSKWSPDDDFGGAAKAGLVPNMISYNAVLAAVPESETEAKAIWSSIARKQVRALPPKTSGIFGLRFFPVWCAHEPARQPPSFIYKQFNVSITTVALALDLTLQLEFTPLAATSGGDEISVVGERLEACELGGTITTRWSFEHDRHFQVKPASFDLQIFVKAAEGSGLRCAHIYGRMCKPLLERSQLPPRDALATEVAEVGKDDPLNSLRVVLGRGLEFVTSERLLCSADIIPAPRNAIKLQLGWIDVFKTMRRHAKRLQKLTDFLYHGDLGLDYGGLYAHQGRFEADEKARVNEKGGEKGGEGRYWEQSRLVDKFLEKHLYSPSELLTAKRYAAKGGFHHK
ncbi:Pentatricopeptide repeat-containing protein [Symbiodinium microadriaticum]|uniref:Pentatricopeptide repeat-containing protein n=1 Tax=Symbiodinium microadriaticum TaxID=2951 RepID=A0A1Q9DS83_SYMMI|nr:Pentatricopeptide repeat-containing protein [Symbiodinium microadriaticum]